MTLPNMLAECLEHTSIKFPVPWGFDIAAVKSAHTLNPKPYFLTSLQSGIRLAKDSCGIDPPRLLWGGDMDSSWHPCILPNALPSPHRNGAQARRTASVTPYFCPEELQMSFPAFVAILCTFCLKESGEVDPHNNPYILPIYTSVMVATSMPPLPLKHQQAKAECHASRFLVMVWAPNMDPWAFEGDSTDP